MFTEQRSAGSLSETDFFDAFYSDRKLRRITIKVQQSQERPPVPVRKIAGTKLILDGANRLTSELRSILVHTHQTFIQAYSAGAQHHRLL